MARLERTRITEQSGIELLRPAVRGGLALARALGRSGAAAGTLIGGAGLLGSWMFAASDPFLLVALVGLVGSWALLDNVIFPVTEDAVRAALVRRRWRSTRPQTCSVADLAGLPVGTPVAVKARIRARTSIQGLVRPGSGRTVWTHVRFSVTPWSPRRAVPVMHDRAEDFELVDDEGLSVWVKVEDAFLLAPVALRQPTSTEVGRRLLALVPPLPGCWIYSSDGGVPGPEIAASEWQLQEGDEVIVFGWKDAALAPGRERLERQAPLETCLRSRPDLPLIVWPRGG